MENAHRVLGQLCNHGSGRLTSWSFGFLYLKNGHKESYFQGCQGSVGCPLQC